MKKRGQYSAEAILILSILLLVVLSIISFREELMLGVTKTYYSSKSRTTTDLILQTAELVYHQGGGARSIIFVSIPKEMINITLSSNILVVNMNISNTPQSFFRAVPFNFNGTIPNEEGNHCLLIESFSGYVEVSEYEGSC